MTKAAYRVVITPGARRQIKKFSRSTQKRVVQRLGKLAAAPRPPGAKKLEGMKDLYRVRVGNYRIIYSVCDKELLVLVVKAGGRGEIYKRTIR